MKIIVFHKRKDKINEQFLVEIKFKSEINLFLKKRFKPMKPLITYS